MKKIIMLVTAKYAESIYQSLTDKQEEQRKYLAALIDDFNTGQVKRTEKSNIIYSVKHVE